MKLCGRFGKMVDRALAIVRHKALLALLYDRLRLRERVYDCLMLGGWWTLSELRRCCGGSEAEISAQIQELIAHASCGPCVIQRRRCSEPQPGFWEYQLLASASSRAKIAPNGTM